MEDINKLTDEWVKTEEVFNHIKEKRDELTDTRLKITSEIEYLQRKLDPLKDVKAISAELYRMVGDIRVNAVIIGDPF